MTKPSSIRLSLVGKLLEILIESGKPVCFAQMRSSQRGLAAAFLGLWDGQIKF
jgi:hypothetical protein